MRVAAVDQGTTSTRVIVFDASGSWEVIGSRRHAQSHPAPGQVEHDPLELLTNISALLEAAGPVDAIGLGNQGESCLAWDALSGQPLSPVIVWQDARTAADLRALPPGAEALSQSICGLPLDPYFSASKLAWMLRSLPAVQSACAAGRLRLGTTDAFFLDRLTGRFVTDLTTASRTGLLDLASGRWSASLCQLYGVPAACLPEIVSGQNGFGAINGIPVRASMVDQQASLYGHGCRNPGDCKITFGTGAFLLAVTGSSPLGPAGDSRPVGKKDEIRAEAVMDGSRPEAAIGNGRLEAVTGNSGPKAAMGDTRPETVMDDSRPETVMDDSRPETAGLLPTIAWDRPDAPPLFAVEGGVYDAGSALEWARRIGLYSDVSQLASFPGPSALSRGLVFVPALSGLAAPDWDREAAPLFIGMDHATTREDLVRAILEGIAMLTARLAAAASRIAPSDRPVSIDGGLSQSPYFTRFLAAALGRGIRVPALHDITALGLAERCGLELSGMRLHWDIIQPEPLISPQDRLRFDEAIRRSKTWRGTPPG